ncbi:TetR/AcrR family transcriptional regulator [Virgibacillus necropolis]|uniref:TetR family transcriptional regulator n=1 Tax=Virgibacillus necropolis TaxID=163877 RepID=A0A221MHS8_9BACI|nr:TetR/AcrR family transcriptional regulator [Virgibacillus necropolis]ASN07194.1 TetR family transcriptional regulator [Virgibacillus necropolis]
MPKLVDHKKRKIKIAEATWKVIVNEGLEEASVRKIAKVANISVGSLRHYFSTQSELFVFSMQLVSDRVENRAKNKSYEGTPLEAMQDFLSEFLPIDMDRRIEMEVWLVFSTKTLVDPALKELSQVVYDDMHQACSMVVERLTDLGLSSPNLDKNMEIERLYALIDGMALHGILHPDRFSAEKMQATLKYHLESLCEGV